MDTAVALIIFRRPEHARRVLQAIAAVKPRKLLVIADGPRPGRPDDVSACAATRAVMDQIDWPCEVLKHYSDVNLGCGRRPATGISWVFQHVEEAIILEDDCVPHPSFFQFCTELLERYRDDKRVMNIAGTTYQREPLRIPASYCFSHHIATWGWATWRRAWDYYDYFLKSWPPLRETTWLDDVLRDERAVRFWGAQFERAYQTEGDVSYWDYQWHFTCWAQSGLSIVPKVNLITNIGCGPDATHTFNAADLGANVPGVPMEFPMQHPSHVLQDHQRDRTFLQERILPSLWRPPRRRMGVLRRIASKVAPEYVKRWYRQHRTPASQT